MNELISIKEIFKDFYWGCTRYREGCKGTLSDEESLALSLPSLINTVEQTREPSSSTQSIHSSCPKCSRNLRSIKGKNGFFWACSGYQSWCKLTLDDKRGRPANFYPCPKWQKPLR